MATAKRLSFSYVGNAANNQKWCMARWIGLGWVLSGLAAFLTSIICFGKGGRPTDHVIGLVLAILYGPVYWLFFFSTRPAGYCK